MTSPVLQNIVFSDLPAWHDHTPAFTARLGAERGETVTLRLKTTLEPRAVYLKVVVHGEIEEFPAREVEALDGEGRWFEIDLRLSARKVHYAWQLVLEEDNVHLTMAGLHRVRRAYRDWFHYLAGYEAPTWAWKSVFYQIFPDRFRNSNPDNDVKTGEYEYAGKPVVHVDWDVPPARDLDIHAHYGGDLEGVAQAMPYIADLGANALWLTPIFVSPSAHRYDIADYRHVDPHLGGEAAFEQMMAAANAHGVKVVLDGVFNHSGSEWHLFKKALSDPHAPEREMFTFRDVEGGKPPYAAFFDVPTLPKIDYSSPMAVNEFFEGDSSVVKFWLERGVAGWRLDVAQQIGVGGTDEGNLELHARLKSAARSVKSDAYVFGERFFDSEAVLTGEGEDGVMNYHGFGLPVMEWFSGETYKGFPSRLPTAELVDLLWDAYHVLAPQIALNQFNLVDSHDISRALKRLGDDKEKLRSVLTLLLGYPGVPCVYYGTEVGLTQVEKGTMPFNRGTMPWDESKWDLDLRRDVQALIRVRKETRALQEGAMRMLHAGEDAVGFLRTYTREDGTPEKAAVFASRRGEAHEVSVNLPSGEWRNAVTGAVVSNGGATTLDVGRGLILVG
ncbi:alpha-amylase family glycosyl hydrolase [Deinococcus yavapaiensis]|uniref:Alpha-glucosidase n=1 Tax=Deinococcus yavapaiensis KR-236 TaxID=694435 RepID=A0A318SCE4_9DEIO|nr:alpha-amylase family glycosyl hydrolase [Deinococcus yavapaiensis]PYE56511.1 alpha-glucosidase [Deinococcus yavapaiensis KR-236]